jgi:hypothetical protein
LREVLAPGMTVAFPSIQQDPKAGKLGGSVKLGAAMQAELSKPHVTRQLPQPPHGTVVPAASDGARISADADSVETGSEWCHERAGIAEPDLATWNAAPAVRTVGWVVAIPRVDSGKGFRVVDVWESEEAFQRFSERLEPIIKAIRIDVIPETYKTQTFVSA